MCHYCGYSIPYFPVPFLCGETLRFRGSGTQQAEEQLQEILPQAKILRRYGFRFSPSLPGSKSWESFAQGRIMTSWLAPRWWLKGWTLKRHAGWRSFCRSTALYSVTDFRSNEENFDLLTQVVGRAGRRPISRRGFDSNLRS